LRPFHRERRLYARLWLDDSGGLHGLEFCRGKQGSVGADAKIP
jgi:hypothetical protein